MTDREKLIELLGAAEDDYLAKISEVMTQEQRYEMVKNAYAYYADHLLANGVTVQKHGRWVEKPFLFGTSNFCSLCDSFYGMPHGKYNYCPNCGAKMDLEG